MKLYINYGYRLLNMGVRLAINIVCLKLSSNDAFSEQFFVSNLLSTLIIFGLIDLILFKNFGVGVLNSIVPRFLIIFLLYGIYIVIRGEFNWDKILLTGVLVLYFVGLRAYDYKLLLMRRIDYVYVLIQCAALLSLILFSGLIENLLSFAMVVIYLLAVNCNRLELKKYYLSDWGRLSCPMGCSS
jgi:hypothetical protein